MLPNILPGTRQHIATSRHAALFVSSDQPRIPACLCCKRLCSGGPAPHFCACLMHARLMSGFVRVRQCGTPPGRARPVSAEDSPSFCSRRARPRVTVCPTGPCSDPVMLPEPLVSSSPTVAHLTLRTWKYQTILVSTQPASLELAVNAF